MRYYLLFLFCFLGTLPIIAQTADTAVVPLPPRDLRMHLYLSRPFSSLPMAPPERAELYLPIDPFFSRQQQEDELFMTQMLTVHQMGQAMTDKFQKEQRDMRALGIISNIATGFCWGMIIKENIEGYINYQSQQKQQAAQPQPMPARPAEVRPPAKR